MRSDSSVVRTFVYWGTATSQGLSLDHRTHRLAPWRQNFLNFSHLFGWGTDISVVGPTLSHRPWWGNPDTINVNTAENIFFVTGQDTSTLVMYGAADIPLSCPSQRSGHFCRDGLPPMLPCPAGTKSNTDLNATTCDTCPGGTWAGAGSTVCTPCSPRWNGWMTVDTYSPPGAAQCTEWGCPQGSARNNSVPWACQLCAAGTFQSTITPSAPCLPCEPGSFSATPGAVTCQQCPAGTVSPERGANSSSTCRAVCPPGTYRSSSPNTACLPCPAGSWNNASNSSSCQVNPPGMHTPREGMTAPLPCPNGTYTSSWPSSYSQCTVCPGGFIELRSVADSNVCQTRCPAGWYCLPGWYSGQSPPSGSVPCPHGTYRSTPGAFWQSDCLTCPAGTYADLGFSDCLSCPAGTYADVAEGANSTSCRACPVGSWSSPGSTQCTLCPAGSFSITERANNNSVCKLCPAGYASASPGASSPSTCQPCPEGTGTAEGSPTCIPCLPGTYAPNATMGACLWCPIGFFSRQGSSSCQNTTITAHGLQSTLLRTAVDAVGPGRGWGAGRAFVAAYAFGLPNRNYRPIALDANGTLYAAASTDLWNGDINQRAPFLAAIVNASTVARRQVQWPNAKPLPEGQASDAAEGAAVVVRGPASSTLVLVTRSAISGTLASICYQGSTPFNERVAVRVELLPGRLRHAVELSSATYEGCIVSSQVADFRSLSHIRAESAGRWVAVSMTQNVNGQGCCGGTYVNCFYYTRERLYWSVLLQYNDTLDGPPSQVTLYGVSHVLAIRDDGLLATVQATVGTEYRFTTQYNTQMCTVMFRDAVTHERRASIQWAAWSSSGSSMCNGYNPLLTGACSVPAAFDAAGNLHIQYTVAGSTTSTYTVLNTSSIQLGSIQQPYPDGTDVRYPVVYARVGRSLEGSGLSAIMPAHLGAAVVRAYAQIQANEVENATHLGRTLWSYDPAACAGDMQCPSPCKLITGTCTPPNTIVRDMLIDAAGTVYVLIDGVVIGLDGLTGQVLWTFAGPTADKSPSGMLLSREGTLFVTGAAIYAITPCPAGMACNDITTTAVECVPGFYTSEKGQAECAACPAGTYQRFAGSTTCTACPAGTYSSETGAASMSACLPCDAGYYSTTVGASSVDACVPCPTGTYSSLTGAGRASTCLPCGAGTYAEQEGQVMCTLCPRGTENPSVGANSSQSCLPCARGSFASAEGQGSCLGRCPAGWTANAQAVHISLQAEGGTALLAQPPTSQEEACERCPAGTFSVSGGFECTPCAAGTYAPQPGSPSCTPCPVGTFGSRAGARNATSCAACPAGTFNELQGQTRLGCVTCPPGTASPTLGASSEVVCTTCPPGSYAPAGATQCVECPAGSYGSGAGLQSCTVCPRNTYNPRPGSTSVLDCAACPAGTTTLVAGASSVADCTEVSFKCPAGMQAKSATATPRSMDDCSPLVCLPPVMPVTAAGQVLLAQAGGGAQERVAEACGGCPPGTVGILQAGTGVQTCASCSSSSSSGGEVSGPSVCPGLVSIPLPSARELAIISAGAWPWQWGNGQPRMLAPGTGTAPSQSMPILSPVWRCPGGPISLTYTSSSPVTGQGGEGGNESTALGVGMTVALSAVPLLNSTSAAVVAAGAVLTSFGFVAAAILRARRRQAVRKLTSGPTRPEQEESDSPLEYLNMGASFHPVLRGLSATLRGLDMFALSHKLQPGEAVVYVPTDLGGACSLAGYMTLLLIAVVLALRREADNVLVQQSLSILNNAAMQTHSSLPWATHPAVQAPSMGGVHSSEPSVLRVRAFAAGELGACSRPLSWTAEGLTAGRFYFSDADASIGCGGMTNGTHYSVHQLVWTCSACQFSSTSRLLFSLHWSCQSLVLETVASNPDGTSLTVSTHAEVGTEGEGAGEEGAGGSNSSASAFTTAGLLSKLTWPVMPLLAVQRDERSGASMRGYTLLDTVPDITRQTLDTAAVQGSTHRLAFQPATLQSVQVVIQLPLQPFSSMTILSEKTSTIQLFANIAGLTGVLALFGLIFRYLEGKWESHRAVPSSGHTAATSSISLSSAGKGKGASSVFNPLHDTAPVQVHGSGRRDRHTEQYAKEEVPPLKWSAPPIREEALAPSPALPVAVHWQHVSHGTAPVHVGAELGRALAGSASAETSTTSTVKTSDFILREPALHAVPAVLDRESSGETSLSMSMVAPSLPASDPGPGPGDVHSEREQVEQASTVWVRYCDGEDVWFVRQDGQGEPVWLVPDGDIVIDPPI